MEATTAAGARRPFGRRRSAAAAALFVVTVLVAGAVIWLAIAGDEEQIVVVAPAGRAEAVADLRGEVVLVTGTVRRAGEADVPGVDAGAIEGDIAIQASTVDAVGPEREGVQVEEIADGGAELAGDRIAVLGRLEERLGARTFTLEALDR